MYSNIYSNHLKQTGWKCSMCCIQLCVYALIAVSVPLWSSMGRRHTRISYLTSCVTQRYCAWCPLSLPCFGVITWNFGHLSFIRDHQIYIYMKRPLNIAHGRPSGERLQGIPIINIRLCVCERVIQESIFVPIPSLAHRIDLFRPYNASNSEIDFHTTGLPRESREKSSPLSVCVCVGGATSLTARKFQSRITWLGSKDRMFFFVREPTLQ